MGGAAQVPAPDERLSVDRSIGSALDRGFVAVLAVSLFVHCSVVLAINSRNTPPREEEWVETIPFHHSWLPSPRPKSETPPKAASSRAGSAGARPAQPREPKASRAEMAEDVRRHLQWIGGDRAGTKSGIEDTLFAGRSPETIEDALKGSRSHADIDESFLPSSRREGTAQPSDIGELSTKGARDVSLDDRGVGKRLRFHLEDSEPIPEPSGCEPSSVTAVVKRNLRAIAMCYERELRRLPGLRGKLILRIQIGANGHVEDVDVDEDALHNAAVERCVTRIIRIWRFPPPGQACPVVYPFVFVPME